jgi:hypothetical protein
MSTMVDGYDTLRPTVINNQPTILKQAKEVEDERL